MRVSHQSLRSCSRRARVHAWLGEPDSGLTRVLLLAVWGEASVLGSAERCSAGIATRGWFGRPFDVWAFEPPREEGADGFCRDGARRLRDEELAASTWATLGASCAPSLLAASAEGREPQQPWQEVRNLAHVLEDMESAVRHVACLGGVTYHGCARVPLNPVAVL